MSSKGGDFCGSRGPLAIILLAAMLGAFILTFIEIKRQEGVIQISR